MTDEQKKPPLLDETPDQDDAPTRKKGKRRPARKPKDAPVQPALTVDLPQEGGSQPDLETPADDDPLGEVRRALMEEEEAKPKSKWRGIFKRKKKTDQAEEATLVTEGMIAEPASEGVDVSRIDDRAHLSVEESLPRSPGVAHAALTEPVPTSTPEAVVESPVDAPLEEDILKSILGIETSTPLQESQEVITPPPPAEADETEVIDKARRREILRPEPGEEQAGDIEAIREEALRDYSDEPLQSEDEQPLALRQKTRMLFSGLRPFEKLLLFGIAVVLVIAGLFGVGAVVNSLQGPAVTPTIDPTIPFPMDVTLPGGWSFHLNKGKVVDGRWDPTGPEWLEGTELCKWVALPWSTQLEAVVRTLKADDPIELGMSNADRLTFKVQSIKSVPVDQIETLQTSATCLLLILSDEDGDSRWVVTAIP